MLQDQGFQDSNLTQIVQVNYTPMFPKINFRRKYYANPLKLLPIKNSLDSVFMNKQLQQELYTKFKQSHTNTYMCYDYKKPCQYSNNSLMFQSNFQNGNLEYVTSEDKTLYQLYLKPDTNTKHHFQWFYFKVKSLKSKKVIFVIKNFIKNNMLYRKGLKPYYKSLKKKMTIFQQLNTQCKYQQIQQEQQEQKKYYKLQFTFFFEQNDEVFFSSQPPYTYQFYLKFSKTLKFERQNVASTILNKNIQMFTINEKSNYKTIVFVLARQHPGQSVGSWMMHGFLKKLNNHVDNDILWIIIPFFNVDGAIAGNNRTGMLGYDFNRHWNIDEDNTNQDLFPEISGVFKYLKQKKKDFHKKTKIFIDFHGHSSQQNVFSYGPPHSPNSEYYQKSKLFPYLINKVNSDFNIDQCSNTITTNKRNCARAVMFNKFGFTYSYTIESSFGIYRGRLINETDMIKMGQSIHYSLISFINLLGEKQAKIIQMIKQMKQKQQKYSDIQIKDDSQSEDQCLEVNKRKQFLSKITNLVKNIKNNQDQSINKNNKQNPLKKPFLSNRLSLNCIQKQKKDKPSKNFIKHIKTQSFQQIASQNKQKINRNKTVNLPKLYFTSKQKEKLSYKTQTCNQTSFENLSLKQIKQRLLKLKNSKLDLVVMAASMRQNFEMASKQILINSITICNNKCVKPSVEDKLNNYQKSCLGKCFDKYIDVYQSNIQNITNSLKSKKGENQYDSNF